MTPHEAGALLNTAQFALDQLDDLQAQARTDGLELAPVETAMREALLTRKLAERWLVRV